MYQIFKENNNIAHNKCLQHFLSGQILGNKINHESNSVVRLCKPCNIICESK